MGNKRILTSLSGAVIRSIDDWETFRKSEIKELFANYVYGVVPDWCPKKLQHTIEAVDENFCGKEITYTKTTLHCDGFSFPIQMFVPHAEKPVPAFVFVMHEYQEDNCDLEKEPNCRFLPVFDITDRGYAAVVMPTRSIYPDWEHHAEYQQGIFRLMPGQETRNEHSWATIAAWAWGAQRVMDYLETQPQIDIDHVAVAGHSRSGKTALWCGACDPRFQLVISNNSGCMGAALLKGKRGERVKDINITDWFCKKFHSFNGREEFLPVDQDMLLALMAPRLLYVASSFEDTWADPEAELRACKMASCAYELYGEAGLSMECETAEVGVPYHAGRIGYHVKSGEHGLMPFDWKLFMDFWDAKIKAAT